jgi:hypothetical protein
MIVKNSVNTNWKAAVDYSQNEIQKTVGQLKAQGRNGKDEHSIQLEKDTNHQIKTSDLKLQNHSPLSTFQKGCAKVAAVPYFAFLCAKSLVDTIKEKLGAAPLPVKVGAAAVAIAGGIAAAETVGAVAAGAVVAGGVGYLVHKLAIQVGARGETWGEAIKERFSEKEKSLNVN